MLRVEGVGSLKAVRHIQPRDTPMKTKMESEWDPEPSTLNHGEQGACRDYRFELEIAL